MGVEVTARNLILQHLQRTNHLIRLAHLIVGRLRMCAAKTD
jgi:hypothetical protein